jgi:hypothetical protein
MNKEDRDQIEDLKAKVKELEDRLKKLEDGKTTTS